MDTYEGMTDLKLVLAVFKRDRNKVFSPAPHMLQGQPELLSSSPLQIYFVLP